MPASPPLRAAWRTKPAAYLGHLLGHEGPGSLLSALAARGWATALWAGETEDASCFALFEVGIELSPAGLAAAEGVLELLFAYLGMLQAHGPQRWAWEEDAAVRAAKFRFATAPQPLDAATAGALCSSSNLARR